MKKVREHFILKFRFKAFESSEYAIEMKCRAFKTTLRKQMKFVRVNHSIALYREPIENEFDVIYPIFDFHIEFSFEAIPPIDNDKLRTVFASFKSSL